MWSIVADPPADLSGKIARMAGGSDLYLVDPEWHGCGPSARRAGEAARRLGARLFTAREVVEVTPGPDDASGGDEAEHREDGVDWLAAVRRQALAVTEVLNLHAPARVFAIGGTCGSELAPVAYLNRRHRGRLGVLWIDAHGDLNTPASSPSGRFHGMVLRTLLGEGPPALASLVPCPLVPRHVVLAGTRDLDPPERTFVHDAKVAVVPVAEFERPDVLAGVLRQTGCEAVYIHLDLDVLDPSECPDVLVPTPGGVSQARLAAAVRAVTSTLPVAGFSVVELLATHAAGVAAVTRLAQACGHPAAAGG